MKLQEEVVRRWQEVEPLKPRGSYLPPTAGLAAASAAPIEASEQESKRERFLAADGQRPTPREQEAMLGTNDLLDVNFLDRCTLVSQAIGRIDARSPDGRVRATGFLIAPGLLMTNHHVFPDREVASSGSIEFGYRYDVAGEITGTTRFDLAPDSFYVADEELDYAVVAVKPTSLTGREEIDDFGYLRLHPESGKVREREFVTIIQHPEGQPLQIALRENQVTRLETGSHFIQYEADTAHGSSGAPAFNDSLQVAALHSSGRIKRNAAGEFMLKNGGTATSLKGLADADVIWETNVGVRVSSICPDLLQKAEAARPSFVPVLQQAMSGGDILARAVVAARTSTPGPSTPVSTQPNDSTEKNSMRPEAEHTETRTPATGARDEHDGRGISIPLTLRVTLEDPRAGAQVQALATGPAAGREEKEFAAEAFKMQVPVIYDGLDEREGFDPNFLELGGGAGSIEMPRLTAKGKQVAAPLLEDGGFVLRYHKFSVIMHKERRLAIITASNVDWRDFRRKIDGKKPSRDDLTGIHDERVIEQWVTDERISARHQLPDVFYTEDRKAFDKGHLVRRDDVCWGDTFEDMQMANGDTYHVTNCSPQIGSLNQASKGQFNWGDFENEVQQKTKAEKVIIFAGPVLDPKDRWFRGLDDQGPVRVQTPSRFWKIVVAKGEDGPEAFGFIFKQDVRSITEKEFALSPEWAPAAIRINEISKLLRGWVDVSHLEAIDHFAAS